MSFTDPIANMLTLVRNASRARHEKVDIPHSKLLASLAALLKSEGFIDNFRVIKDNKQGVLRIFLKYTVNNQPVIKGLKRESKPGRRIYMRRENIPAVLSGLGVGILSTSKGILTDFEARKQSIGGEYICSIW